MDEDAHNDNNPHRSGMRIYIFKSNANSGDTDFCVRPSRRQSTTLDFKSGA
jgi:hypothetical protein